MTETEMKLSDAAIQLQLAKQFSGQDEQLRSCINAFISNARSVTLVMQAESGHGPLEHWYEQQMSQLLASEHGPMMRFFNNRRVHSIHKGVVIPTKIEAEAMEFRVNGVLQKSNPTVTFYRFEGVEEYLPGRSGGVYGLCETYLHLLRSLVKEWLCKRRELETSSPSNKPGVD